MDITNIVTNETDFILVNMQYVPQVTMKAGTWYRWRILLASVSARLVMAPEEGKGCEVQLLAKDGIYLADAPRPVSDIFLAAGNRADVAVRCSKVGDGEVFMINKEDEYNDDLGFNEQEHIMRLNIEEQESNVDSELTDFTVPFPCYLVDLEGVDASALSDPLDINFTFTPIGPSINNVQYNPEKYFEGGKPVELGTVRDVNLNPSNQHPYHQHVNPFQIMVMDEDTESVKTWYQVGDWQDVLQTINATTAKVRFQAATFNGPMVMHCHILFHEDLGMMTQFNLSGVPGTTWLGAEKVDPKCVPPGVPAGPSGCKYYDNQKEMCKVKGCKWNNKDSTCHISSSSCKYYGNEEDCKLANKCKWKNCKSGKKDKKSKNKKSAKKENSKKSAEKEKSKKSAKKEKSVYVTHEGTCGVCSARFGD